MTAVAQLGLFLSSFAPLFVVFALLDTFGAGWPSRGCVALATIGVVLFPSILAVARKLAPQQLKIATAQVRDSDALAYVATYIVPFAAMGGSTTRDRIAIGIFVALVAVLYVRSHLFYINPLLAAVGYRMFQVATPGGASVVLLTRRRFLTADSVVHARRLSEYVWWENNT